MKDFDIVKYLREHQLGSYGILNHYVDLKPINELGVEQDSMYDPYADEYNHNAMPGTNSVYNAASKKADELEKQAKQAEKMRDPNARQLRLAAAEAREEAFKYAQMFRETVSEEEQEVELNTEIPYEGPEHKLTGNGEGDEFEQAETVSEMEYGKEPDYSRIMDLGGEKIEQGIISLLDDGFSEEDVLELCKEFVEGQTHMRAADTRIEKLKQDIGYLGRGLEEESISENRLEDLVNRRDLAAVQNSIQNIFDDLTDYGFPAEDIERYLVNYVRNAAVPYLLK